MRTIGWRSTGFAVALLAALVASTFWLEACTPAEATVPRNVRATVQSADDSLSIIVAWVPAAAPGPRQAPTASYIVRLVQGTDTVARGTTGPAVARDTLTMAWPPLGAQSPVTIAVVAAVDTLNQVSPFAASGGFRVTNVPQLPNPPSGVTVDTSLVRQAAAELDSMTLVPVLMGAQVGYNYDLWSDGTIVARAGGLRADSLLVRLDTTLTLGGQKVCWTGPLAVALAPAAGCQTVMRCTDGACTVS